MKRAGGAEPVAKCILAYLLESPEAEDSIVGIVEWWVMRQRIRFETARVKQALSNLVKEGLILERRTAGSAVRYRLNKQKLGDIKRLLGAGKARAGSVGMFRLNAKRQSDAVRSIKNKAKRPRKTGRES